MSDPRPLGLPSTFWLGGGSGAGKTTVARAVVRRLDLRLCPVDGYTYAHLDRSRTGDYPLHRALAAMTAEQRWRPDPEELAARFAATSQERFGMICDDLRALFPFSCECETRGCERVVSLPVSEYQRRSATGPVIARAT